MPIVSVSPEYTFSFTEHVLKKERIKRENIMLVKGLLLFD